MRVLDLALKDLVQTFRDHKSALFLVLMPLVFTVFIGLIFRFGPSDPRLPVGLVVEDGAEAPLVGVLVGLLEASEGIRVEMLDAAADLEEAVRDQDLAGGLVVPAGLSEAALRGEAPQLRGIVRPTDPAGTAVQAEFEAVASRLQAIAETARLAADAYEERRAFAGPVERQAFLDEAVERAAVAWGDPPVRLRAEAGIGEREEGIDAPSGFLQSSPGIMVQFAVFGLISSASVLVVERNSGALRRMLSTPIRRWEIVGGHLLALFATSFLQLVILVVFGQLALGVRYLSAPGATLVMIAALALFASGLGLLLGALTKTVDQVVMFALILMFILTGLGGAWFPLEITGDTFSRIGHLLPTAWAMDGLQNVVVRGLGLGSVLLPAGIVVAWAVALLALAAWRLRPE
jgi:ABC-2 type transport system permease protein